MRPHVTDGASGWDRLCLTGLLTFVSTYIGAFMFAHIFSTILYDINGVCTIETTIFRGGLRERAFGLSPGQQNVALGRGRSRITICIPRFLFQFYVVRWAKEL
jgi:hypothetical protein